MKNSIKYAILSDVEQMANVHLQTWKQVYKGIFSQKYLNNLTTKHWIEQFKKGILSKKIQYLIVECDKKIVGVISFGCERFFNDISCGEIYALYVLPSYQGKSYGKQLLEQAISLMKKKYKKIFIRVVVENYRAYGFYIENGFIDTKQVEKFELNGGQYQTNLLVIENKEIE